MSIETLDTINNLLDTCILIELSILSIISTIGILFSCMG